MKKKYKRPKRLYNGFCKRPYKNISKYEYLWQDKDCIVHFKKGRIFLVEFNGNKRYFKNGKLHREDGPAFEHRSGLKQWIINGLLHRLDGPAYEDNYGQSWYLNNEKIEVDSQEEFVRYLNTIAFR